MANVKFFTQGDGFYIADKGGAVAHYTPVSAIADALNNICRSQNVPHGPNDSNRELVDKILEQCGGYDSDPNQARVSVKLGKMINDPIVTYHILRTETGEFHVLFPRGFVHNMGYLIGVARQAGVKKFEELRKLWGDDFWEKLAAQYNVYDVLCEIYDFTNSPSRD